LSGPHPPAGRPSPPAPPPAPADAGLQGVSVSIDGLEASHDALRGRGSFQSAIEALGNAELAGIPLRANTQINRRNERDLEALFDLLVDRRVTGWQVALTVPMGRAADDPELVLQPYRLDDVYPRIAELARRAIAKGMRFSRGNNLGYFGPFEEAFFEPSEPDYACGCGAGSQIIGVEADGTIKGCPSLVTDHWSGGTVREAALVDIWERAPKLQALRDPAALWGFCATCYYADECRAGCTWTADSLLGKPGNNPYCHHRVVELKKSGLRERVVRTHAPPGRPFDRGEFEIVLEEWPAGA
jgi:radical SAM protein with 4Fe4S-binding SPASM domain